MYSQYTTACAGPLVVTTNPLALPISTANNTKAPFISQSSFFQDVLDLEDSGRLDLCQFIPVEPRGGAAVMPASPKVAPAATENRPPTRRTIVLAGDMTSNSCRS